MIQVGIFLIDLFSFGLGFFTGAMFLFLMTQFIRLVPAWFRGLREAIKAVRRSMSANAEARLANELIAYTQRQHLAANLFSINEIAIKPTLIAPPPPADINVEYLVEEITHSVFPYMPDWPEAAGVYGAPNFTLAEALQGGASILLMGHPGSGKSFALAYFANQLLTGEDRPSALKDKVPLPVHAADLLPKIGEKEPISAIVSAMSNATISAVVQPSLKDILEVLFKDGRGLLLIDGLDEFGQAAQVQMRDYLSRLKLAYPNLQMVVAASLEYYAGLNTLGLLPLAMSAWSDRQRLAFVEQWQSRWQENIQKLMAPTSVAPEGLLMKGWLFSSDTAMTPLELTLRAWGAFAGDMLAPEFPKLIETHIRRVSANAPNLRTAMEYVAQFMVSNEKLLLTQREADNVARKGSGTTPSPKSEEGDTAEEKPASRSGSSLQSLIETGLLAVHTGGMVRFIHPVFSGYLAGKSLAYNPNAIEPVVKQPNWSGKLMALQFLGVFGDLTPAVTQMVEMAEENPLRSELFIAARFLRVSQRSQAWRSTVMRSLANIIYREYETSALAVRATVALAVSGDPGSPALFRQLLRSQTSMLRRLSVLGLGLIGDPKSIAEISPLADDEDKNVGRAACMALVRIGTKQAVDALINILLHGSEVMRIAASESLAIHPTEGMNILKEALTTEDLLVRRAAVFGLVRVNPPDLASILEEVAVKDAQWVVRNAAGQALEMIKNANPLFPRPNPPMEDIPWLLTYAGKNGVGLANEKQAFDMVLEAVEQGDETEKILALQLLNLRGNEQATLHVYNTYFGSRDELRDTAFTTLWHMNASGEKLASPVQFGLGH